MESRSPATAPAGRRSRRRGWMVGLLAACAAAVAALVVVCWPAGYHVPHETEPARDTEIALGPPLFQDVTAASGIDFTYRSGEEADLYTILESLGGGVAMIDYDRDGLLDLFFTGGGYFQGKDIKGHPCKLYKNLGNWKFRDVTAEVGLDRIDFYTHGVAVADYDCDGWPDLLVTGYGRLALFRNVERDGRRQFVDVTEKAGLDDALWSTSAGFADLSGNGFPDLYVCHYVDWSFANDPPCKERNGSRRDVCSPLVFNSQPHALFFNQGDGTFRRAPAQMLRKDGNGLGVILADLNGDGRPDIYVANDLNENDLYVNRGNRKLEEIAFRAGVARDADGHANGSMGVDVGDFDGSGRPSIFVANFQAENHALYLNQGRERFVHASHAAGLAALGQTFVGFGAGFVDFDNDGWEDLVIANGHVLRYPSGSTQKQLPVLMRNVPRQGRRFFKNVSQQGGPYFRTPIIGRGLAIGDLDNDGWPDIVVSHSNSPVVLLRNQAVAGPNQRWLGVKLVGRKARDLVGTTVMLDDGTRTLTRFVKGGGSYLSASDPRILFGLGPAGRCKRLSVRWSWGETQHWDNLEPGRYWVLREGESGAAKQ